MIIVKEPSSILKQQLQRVENIDDSMYQLINEMREIMVKARGVGLAANQIGKNLSIFVIDKNLAEQHSIPDCYINPQITEYSKEKDELEEGCLSIPDYWVMIKRSKKIKIKATSMRGEKIKLKIRGFAARVLQHEMDHLNGLLIRDRVMDVGK
jgi:peptide deformylase